MEDVFRKAFLANVLVQAHVGNCRNCQLTMMYNRPDQICKITYKYRKEIEAAYNKLTDDERIMYDAAIKVIPKEI